MSSPNEIVNASKDHQSGLDNSLSEFDIIRRYFSDIGRNFQDKNKEIILSGGDDCALLAIPEQQRLALSIDTLVADRHFPADANPYDIACRALAVSVSDLAAMGAKPVAFTLALTLPDFNQTWLEQFSQGLSASAQKYEMALIGGDTTRGPLSITVQVHGVVNSGEALRRSGAQPGDKIYVSGSLGDAAAALDILQKRLVADDGTDYFYHRFYQPSARVRLGQALLGVAHSAIDISDGLLADLGHILNASDVAAKLYSKQLPYSKAMASLLDKNLINTGASEVYMLTGGDDYELCFTAPAEQSAQLREYAELFDVPITEVGEIVSCQNLDQDRLQCFDGSGNLLRFEKTGFQHF